MKLVRKMATFPFEVLLAICVAVYVIVDYVCHAVGWLCRAIEGDQT